MPPERPTFAWLARVAPQVKEAELRLLIHLALLTARKAKRKDKTPISLSLAELSDATAMSRQSLIHAIEALATRGLLIVEQGSGRVKSTYVLRSIKTTKKIRSGDSR